MIRQPPRSTPFPYPPLFRSLGRAQLAARPVPGEQPVPRRQHERRREPHVGVWPELSRRHAVLDDRSDHRRSEEHTSELQSRQYLVCRLLLEKKKNIYYFVFC